MSANVLAPGRVFAGRYEVGAVLGHGASSIVHRASDRLARRDVALKVLDPAISWHPEAVERLRREVVVSRRVSHPAVVVVHDLVTDGDTVAVVRELVDGQSLKQHLADRGPMAPSAAIEVVSHLLEALAACHQKGVVHRDLKPSNVLLLATGQVRLIDFGIARIGMMTTVTQTGALLGSPGYQAPEILRGERPDHRVDLYGTGLILYELLTGQPAFPVDDLVPYRQLAEPAPSLRRDRPDLPDALVNLVADLLEAEPLARPPDAFEAIARLTELASTKNSNLACLNCGFGGRSAIPSCPRCGALRRLPGGKGTSWVRLRSLDDVAAYSTHLRAQFRGTIDARALARIKAATGGSVLLARDLNPAAAAALAADAQRFGAAVEVGDGKTSQLREPLPTWQVVATLAGIALPLFLMVINIDTTAGIAAHPAMLVGLVLAIAVGLGGYVYRSSSRPVLPAKVLRAASRPARDQPLAVALTRRVAGIVDPALATAAATLLDDAWRLGHRASQSFDEATTAMLDACLTLAERADAVARQLGSRGAGDAARDAERTRARIRQGQLGPEAEAIAVSFVAESIALDEAEQQLAVAQGSLYLACGQLRRLERSSPTTDRQLALAQLLAAADRHLLDLALSSQLDEPVSPSPVR